MITIDQLAPAERDALYQQVGDAMFAPGFSLQGHIDGNTHNGVFVPPVHNPPAPDGQAPRAPDSGSGGGVGGVGTPAPQPAVPDVPLPAVGTPAYQALLLETGRSDLVGFSYAAHLAAKGDRSLSDFDRYLNAASGAELVSLLGQVSVNDLVVQASSAQVQVLVSKFSSDPAFAAFLNMRLDASPPMVRVGGSELQAYQVAWQAPTDAPLPAFGSPEYKALLLETGRSDLIGFNYGAHLAAKAGQALASFDQYFNAPDGAALVALLGSVNVNELMSRASPEQVRQLVTKFASDPTFAVYLDAATRPELPRVDTPAYEALLQQTGRSNLVGFNYEAHLRAMTEATQVLAKVGLTDLVSDTTQVAGGTGRDVIRAQGNTDTLLSAGTGNDSLIGAAGNDVLIGGEGNDRMQGGAGDDVYHIDSARDIVIEAAAAAGGQDTAIAAANFRLPRGVETLILSEGNWTGTGNAEANTLIGSSGTNRLDGGAGKDTLTGGAGEDVFVIGGPGRGFQADVITDFSDDQLVLSKRSFSVLKNGFSADNFALGAPADANDYLVYRDGTLYYDPDISGPRAAIALVELTGSPSLLASQIVFL